MPEPFRVSAAEVDLSGRVAQTSTVQASPAAAAETIVATTPALDRGLSFALGVIVLAELAYTIGATGASVQLRIRRTNIAGAVVYDSGAQTGGRNAAGLLCADSAAAVDLAPAAGQVYVVTLTIGGGSGASAVSSALLLAIAV